MIMGVSLQIALQKKSLGGKIPANSPEYSTDKRRLFVLYFSAANDSDCQVFTRKITVAFLLPP